MTHETIHDKIDKLVEEMGCVKTDISWLKNALLGIYGTLGVAFLAEVAKAFFG